MTWQAKDIKSVVCSCVSCQKAKVTQHIKSPIATFALPDACFGYIHFDFIGPFPPSDGNLYFLTIIDKFTIWLEVIPIPTPDMTTEQLLVLYYIGGFLDLDALTLLLRIQEIILNLLYYPNLCNS